jgi:hypothetical protein
VAGLERIDDMQTLLNDVASEYKLIDLKFRPINGGRFHEIILAQEGSTKVINVRLIRVMDDNPLTLAFAEKKLSDCVRDTIILVGLSGVLADLKAQEVQLRKENADADTIDQLKARIKRFTEIVREHHRSRMLNRLLLYAARCQILDPLPRRSERSRDKAVIRRLAAREQEIDKDLEQLYKEDRRQQGVKQSVASVNGEKDTRSLPIPQIFIDGEASEDVRTPRVRQSTLNFFPLQRSHTSLGSTRTSESARTDLETHPTPIVDIRAQRILPSDRERSTIRIGSATLAYPPIPAGRRQKSSEDVSSTFPSAGLSIPPLPDVEPRGQQRHGRWGLRRWHTTASNLGAAPSIVLPASPQRVPLRSEGDSAILAPSRLTDRIRTVSIRADDQWPFNHTSFGMRETQGLNLDSSGQEPILQTVSSRARRKSEERFNGPTPFFEVQTLSHTGESVDSRTVDASMATQKGRSKDDHTINDQVNSTRHEGYSWDNANNILSSIDDLICDGDFGKHTHSLASAIKPNHYNEIELKSESDIISLLQKSQIDERQSTVGLPYQGDDHPQNEFLMAKIELFLGVHGLMGCFIHHEARSEAKIVGKVWGIVHRICELNPHSIPASRTSSSGLTLLPPKHDIQYVDLAGREVRRFEHKWRTLLKHIRDDTNRDESALRYQVPQPLLPAFRNIVLFLLCALLAVNENTIDLDMFNTAGDKLKDGIRESAAAFLRMTELAEMVSDQIGDESIRTADTLLGLLLENAFSFSSRKHVDETGAWGKMSLDIEHIYSTYTSRCVWTLALNPEDV